MSQEPDRDERFEDCFIGLARALRFKPNTADMRIYASALSSLPMNAIEKGAEQLRVQAGRRFFPSTAEWFDAATGVMRQDRAAEEAASRRETKTEPWAPGPERDKFFAQMRAILSRKSMK